jgi:hypothetical protein
MMFICLLPAFGIHLYFVNPEKCQPCILPTFCCATKKTVQNLPMASHRFEPPADALLPIIALNRMCTLLKRTARQTHCAR